MMIDVKGHYETHDRWPLKITKLEPGDSRAFDATPGTYYVMLQQASYYSDNIKFENVKKISYIEGSFKKST